MCRPSPIACGTLLLAALLGLGAVAVNVPVCPTTSSQSVIMNLAPNYGSPSKLSAGTFLILVVIPL